MSLHPKSCLEVLTSRAGPPDTSRHPRSCLEVLRSRAGGLEWSEVDALSDKDQSNMDALEEAMREDWLTAQSSELQDVAEDAEKFFNSLNPKSWVE